jgi:hypothetical protein
MGEPPGHKPIRILAFKSVEIADEGTLMPVVQDTSRDLLNPPLSL